jgi:hypothetical protein
VSLEKHLKALADGGYRGGTLFLPRARARTHTPITMLSAREAAIDGSHQSLWSVKFKERAGPPSQPAGQAGGGPDLKLEDDVRQEVLLLSFPLQQKLVDVCELPGVGVRVDLEDLGAQLVDPPH